MLFTYSFSYLALLCILWICNSLDVCSPEPRRSTDLRKKIKDLWVSWNDYIQRWNALNAKGVDIINAISNTKLKLMAEKESDVLVNDQLQKRVCGVKEQEAYQDLQDYCSKLLDLYNTMKGLVDKMNRTTAELGAMVKYEQHLLSTSPVGCLVRPFETCSLEQFFGTSNTLLQQYTKDLSVKETIVVNVALATDRNVFMRYLVTWMCQPYVSDDSKTMLEAMLVAAGLTS